MPVPQEHQTPTGPLYVHEYLNEPGPYALPEPAEEEPAPDPRPVRRRRRPANTGRTVRTLFSTGMTIVLTVALGASMTLANEPRKLLFSDSFDRPDAAAWGQAGDGQRWMNPTGTSGFALAAGQGVMTVSGRGRSHETTLNTDVRDVTMQFDFSLDKVTGGSGAKIMAVLRKSKAGSYRVRVRLGREGRVWLSVAKAQGQGTGAVIGKPVLIESWRYRAGQTVTVRAQAIKKDPTQLRVKVWPAGSTPPAAWQLVRNDTGADIGGTGRVGLRTMVTRHANNPTATVRFDDVSVNRAQDAEPVAVTPSVARKQPTQPAPAPQPPASQPTKPADTSPPEIIEIGTLEVAQTSATVSWTLDEPATGFVKYGATKAYDRQTKAETDYLQTHIQQLSDLDPGTEYHYAIVSEDPAGNRKVSRDLTFTTKGTAAVAPQPAPTPRPTATPAPTAAATPSATPAPTAAATPSATPAPTAAATPSATPAPTAAATPSATPTDTDKPRFLEVAVTDLTETSATITWTLDEPAMGRLEYGTTTAYGSKTTKEESFDYTTHVQSISGLTPGTGYHFRAIAEDAAGNWAASDDHTFTTNGAAATASSTPAPTPTPAPMRTAEPASTGKKYTDYILPSKWDGHVIDHTGVKDSTPGINAWIQDHAGGTDENNHVRLIFPGGSRLRINAPICVDAGMDHTTFWGHATVLNDGSDPDAVVSSVWIRGDANSYPEPGTQLDPAHITTGTPRHVVFLLGARYNGYENLSYMREVQDIVIRGFDIDGNWDSDSFSERPAGVFYALTVQDFEILYNRSDNQSGDFIRFRAAARGHVHHNYGKRMGRMAITATVNYWYDPNMRSDHVVEYNTFDRSQYWGIDIEPEDEKDTSKQKFVGLTVRNNRFGSFGGNLGGGFFVIGGTATPSASRVMRDITISDNIIDGYGYNANSTSRSMWGLIAHTTNLSGVPVGQDPRPQNITISGNLQTADPYSAPYLEVIRARYVDGLVVTNNDANHARSDWLTCTGCTDVTESGNT
jgi:hypothetical protein